MIYFEDENVLKDKKRINFSKEILSYVAKERELFVDFDSFEIQERVAA